MTRMLLNVVLSCILALSKKKSVFSLEITFHLVACCYSNRLKMTLRETLKLCLSANVSAWVTSVGFSSTVVIVWWQWRQRLPWSQATSQHVKMLSFIYSGFFWPLVAESAYCAIKLSDRVNFTQPAVRAKLSSQSVMRRRARMNNNPGKHKGINRLGIFWIVMIVCWLKGCFSWDSGFSVGSKFRSATQTAICWLFE